MACYPLSCTKEGGTNNNARMHLHHHDMKFSLVHIIVKSLGLAFHYLRLGSDMRKRASTQVRGGHNVLFSKFEYVTGWMSLYNQFQDLFIRKKFNFICPTAIALLDLKIVKNHKKSHKFLI